MPPTGYVFRASRVASLARVAVGTPVMASGVTTNSWAAFCSSVMPSTICRAWAARASSSGAASSAAVSELLFDEGESSTPSAKEPASCVLEELDDVGAHPEHSSASATRAATQTTATKRRENAERCCPVWREWDGIGPPSGGVECLWRDCAGWMVRLPQFFSIPAACRGMRTQG